MQFKLCDEQENFKVKTVVDEDVDVVFQAWVASTGKTRCRLDGKRRKLITDRLREGYSVSDLCEAVDGWRFSPHHRGVNERNTVYNDLELLLRSAGHVDRFREYRLRGGGGGRTKLEDTLARVVEVLT